jgi:hypothetical protein
MSTIPPIQVKVTADTTGLDAGLKTAQQGIKDVDASVKTAGTGMNNFMGNLKKLGATMGVVFAGAQIANFAKDAVMAASTMNESVSKVQVVFQEGSEEVLKFGKNAAESMGISNQKAIEAVGTYGNLLQAVGLTREKSQEMSTTMVQLAGDLASFNNTSVDDALNALRSGLSGETEPLKRFGVALNEVTLKNKALAMGLIETTSGVLPPAIKAQATYALIMEQTTLAQGDYERTSAGTANTIKTLQAKFADASVAVGNMLLPALNLLLKISAPVVAGMEKMATFINENKNALAVFVGVIGVATIAWGAYTVVTKAAAIQQAILNGIMAINPIGAIVVAVAALSAGLVVLWNKNEAFRKAVINVAKVALTAFASIVPMVGQVYEVIMKVVTGPLKALLTVLSKLPGVGKFAKQGLDLMNKGLDGISGFAQGAANKAKILAANLDAVGAAADKSAAKTKAATDSVISGGTTSGTGKSGKVDAKTQTKLDKYAKDVQKIYKNMNEVIADANVDALKAAIDRDEKLGEAQNRYNEAYAEAKKRSLEMDAEANKRHAEQVASIDKDYAKKKVDLLKDLNKKLADLRESAAQKSLDLTKQAAEKQDGILKQSMDRLRTAFASKTGFNLQESFATGKSTDALLKDLKDKLAAAKELQANAAVLAGMGYSQLFIEEVVKNGPEAGNQISKALKAASPEATKELQSLYTQVDTISNHGMDSLAATMNAGGKLATDELRDAYSQVAVDLKNSLAKVDSELQKSLAESNAAYADAMAEAKIMRDEKIAESDAQLVEALAKSKKDLDEATAEAQAILTKTLAEVQKNYEKQIDEINAATQKKLQDLKDKLKEVAAAMAALGAAQAAQAAMAKAPVYLPITGGSSSSGTPFGQAGTTNVTNVNSTFNSTAAPNSYDVQNALIAGVKYGNAVVTTGMAGILTSSAKAPASTSRSMDAVAAARARNGGYL